MLTESQKTMLKKKFNKGYTLMEFFRDLKLDYSNIGEWEDGSLFEAIKESDFIEYLGNLESMYIYRPDTDDIDDFIKKIGYEVDFIDHINWRDRKVIKEVLEYLESNGLIFRLFEEMKFLGIKNIEERET